MTTIEVRSAGLTIGELSIFHDVTLRASSGDTVALVGPSGSGKTSLLHCLGLLMTVTSGQVLVDGCEMQHAKERERLRFWRQRAAFVFQDYGLIDDETAAYNVTLSGGFTPRRLRTISPRVGAALTDVGLSGRERELVAHLSGGERQRVSMARAIHKQASIILADEPTASLDSGNREAITHLLLRQAERGAIVIVATHDEGLAAECGRRHELLGRAQYSEGSGAIS